MTIISKSCFRQNTSLTKLLILRSFTWWIQGLSSTSSVFKYFQGLEFRNKKFKYFQGCVGTLILRLNIELTDEFKCRWCNQSWLMFLQLALSISNTYHQLVPRESATYTNWSRPSRTARTATVNQLMQQLRKMLRSENNYLKKNKRHIQHCSLLYFSWPRQKFYNGKTGH